MKQNFPKHIGRAFVYMLLSLFMCMVAGNASAAERNPVVKIDNTSYTSSGTEVTLKLWMYNDYYSISIRDFGARFTGDVNLYIDDKEVVKLNSIWSSIAGATRLTPIKIPTDNPVDINIDGINVGTALFNNLQYKQTCPDNSNTTEKLWWTVDLKLSFNKSFSYYGHKITVKGTWQDKSSGTVVEKNVALDNTINGFVRPINLKAQPSGGNMVFSWEQEGYNPSASTDGKWIVYKREGDNNVKLGEVPANEFSLSIEKKQYSCSNGYIMTFLPNVCEGEETVCGLTTTIAPKVHQTNADGLCQICGKSIFLYHTSDGNIVDIKGKDFGANVVSHNVVDGECVIEFDAPITRIPAQAFKNSKIKGNLTIPNSVTTIEREAFSYCTELKGSLTLSNSLKTIGDKAFYNCNSLNGSLTIPNTVTTIGISAFENCTGFNGNLTIPNSVTTIGESAFRNCQRFTGDLTIPSSITTIEAYTFNGCFGFNGNLTIPNSVTTIGYRAFYRCSEFTGNLTLPNSITTIEYAAFYGCSGFKGNLTFPDSITSIGEMAFYGCSGFTGNLILPNSITTIGNSAFRGCSGFTGNLTLPNSITTIGESAFYECSGFNGNLTLPNSIATIGTYTFYRCSGFTGNLTLPNSITTINYGAFCGCSGFNGNLTLPNSITTIGEKAFFGCTGFTGNLTLPNSVTTIENSAFSGCSGFTGNLTLPNSITTIKEGTFSGCSGFTGNLTLPNSITTIERLAFSGCTGFTGNLTLPKSLEVVDYNSFYACNNIQTFKFQSLPEVFGGSLNDYKPIVSLSDDSYISSEASGTVNAISYTRQMSNDWGTLVLPYSLTLTGNEPYRLYAIDNITGEELVLKQLDGEVAAGTPCVVKRNGSESELTFGNDDAELNMTIDGKTVGDMTFSGTYWAKEVTDGYVIAKDCFWNVAELMKNKPEAVKGAKVGPFRAWLDGNAAGPARLAMRIDGSTTGINTPDALDALNDAEAEYYDLSGKRLNEPQKGVNIVRMKSGKTKKVIIK